MTSDPTRSTTAPPDSPPDSPPDRAAPEPPALAAGARRSLEALGERPWSEAFYLAGSAALAVHVGHRRVASLDLMSPSDRLTGPRRRDLLHHLLELDAETRVETARDGYLSVRLGQAFGGTSLRFFWYPYPTVDPFARVAGLEVVSALDLGLMKLGAIISRGTRRDFVDLYLLRREVSLEEMLGRSAEKYGHVRDFPLQALKGLADLSLVEGDPMPQLSEPLEWKTVESWLRGEVRRLGRERLGLDSIGSSGKEGDHG